MSWEKSNEFPANIDLDIFDIKQSLSTILADYLSVSIDVSSQSRASL